MVRDTRVSVQQEEEGRESSAVTVTASPPSVSLRLQVDSGVLFFCRSTMHPLPPGPLPRNAWPLPSSAVLSHISAKMPAAQNVKIKELVDAANAIHDAAKVSLKVERGTDTRQADDEPDYLAGHEELQGRFPQDFQSGSRDRDFYRKHCRNRKSSRRGNRI